jgi:hypothetical protein
MDDENEGGLEVETGSGGALDVQNELDAVRFMPSDVDDDNPESVPC